jgi:hypothetical protein
MVEGVCHNWAKPKKPIIIFSKNNLSYKRGWYILQNVYLIMIYNFHLKCSECIWEKKGLLVLMMEISCTSMTYYAEFSSGKYSQSKQWKQQPNTDDVTKNILKFMQSWKYLLHSWASWKRWSVLNVCILNYTASQCLIVARWVLISTGIWHKVKEV